MPPHTHTQEGKWRKASSRVRAQSVTDTQRRVLGNPSAFREGGCSQVNGERASGHCAQTRPSDWWPKRSEGASSGLSEERRQTYVQGRRLFFFFFLILIYFLSL